MKLPTVLMAVQLARDSCRHPVLNAGSSQHVAMAQLQNLTAPNAAGGGQVELRVQVGGPRAFTLARRCERVATFGNVRQVGSVFVFVAAKAKLGASRDTGDIAIATLTCYP